MNTTTGINVKGLRTLKVAWSLSHPNLPALSKVQSIYTKRIIKIFQIVGTTKFINSFKKEIFTHTILK